MAADLRKAGFRSESDAEVMVKKRTKLLSNIGNSMVALRDLGSEDGEAPDEEERPRPVRSHQGPSRRATKPCCRGQASREAKPACHLPTCHVR